MTSFMRRPLYPLGKSPRYPLDGRLLYLKTFLMKMATDDRETIVERVI
jgi:hypothetical protein